MPSATGRVKLLIAIEMATATSGGGGSGHFAAVDLLLLLLLVLMMGGYCCCVWCCCICMRQINQSINQLMGGNELKVEITYSSCCSCALVRRWDSSRPPDGRW